MPRNILDSPLHFEEAEEGDDCMGNVVGPLFALCVTLNVLVDAYK